MAINSSPLFWLFIYCRTKPAYMAYNNYIQARVCIKVKKQKKTKSHFYTHLKYQFFIFHYTLVYLVLRSLASLFSCVLLCVCDCVCYVCRDWLFIKERVWWILKRVTLKGRCYQHTGSWRWRLLLWREEQRIPAPLTDHQRLCVYCLWLFRFVIYSV